MIVYRDASREEPTQEKIGRLLQLADAGDRLALLVELGELEQGVADALHPDRDGVSEVGVRLRTAARAAAAAYLAPGAEASARPHLRRVAAVLASLQRRSLPRTIRIQPPEGFVHYALDPGGYATAAAAYGDAVGRARASRAVVVGVRSIGTSLSAVVAAALGTSRSVTVRPRGRTGRRRVRADRRIRHRLTRWIAGPPEVDVLVVDEGPGVTGETLESVTHWLQGLGVSAERIVLLPSRSWGLPLAPPERRAWFDAQRKYTPPPEDGSRARRVAGRYGLTAPENLSAGRWRAVVSAEDAPACVAHERLKFRCRAPNGEFRLIRYAGVGRWGEETTARARTLAEAGIGVPVRGHAGGFTVVDWAEGAPLDRSAGSDPGFLTALEGYLAARTPRFRTGRPVHREPVVAMLLENAAEALGPNPPGLSAAAHRLARLPEREAVIADARLQPREWLRTPEGYLKVDAVDHGDGLRLPGPTDPAWDLAAAAVEFRLDDAVLARLTARCAAASGDDPDALADAVAAYRPAYAAFAVGNASLSAWEAPCEADRRRLEAEADYYRTALGRELERAAA